MVATVLFLSANPSGTGHLGLDHEHAAIADEKARARLRDAFELEVVLAATTDDFRRGFEEHRPAVVHFGGHGRRGAGAPAERALVGTRDVEPDAGAASAPGEGGELIVEGEGGRAVAVPMEALAEQFRIDCERTRDPIPVRCVVLNACHSAAQARAIAEHVDCVIGTTQEIADEAAIAFARGFYFKLFSGASVKEAFDQGKNDVRAKRAGDPDILVLLCREGVKPEEVRLAEGAGADAPFVVPFPENPHFVGRDEDLERLHRALDERGAAGGRPVMLTGMGGIGKTQIAVAYCHRYDERHRGGVFWVNAAAGDWRPEIARVATAMGLRADGAPEAERQDRLVAAFVQHLRRRPDALVVLDNVDDPADLDTDARAGFVPSALGCRVLFTTRRRDTSGRFRSVEVSVLPEDAAIALLLSGERRGRAAQRDAGEIEAARAIARVLGRLPLALVLAAAYLETYDEIPLGDYLDRIRGEGALPTIDVSEDAAEADARERATLATRHAAAVGATLRLQWDAIRGGDAREVLRTAALLGEAAEVPRARLSLLTGLGEASRRGRPAPLSKALEELYRLSLVEELSDAAIRLHPLVSELVRATIPEAERRAFAEARAARLAEALWALERLHAEVAARGVDAVLSDLRAGAALLDAAAPGADGAQGGPAARDTLWLLRRVLDMEAHRLRAWDPGAQPGFLLQQVRNRCLDSDWTALRERCEAALSARGWPYLRKRRATSRESDALVRTLVGQGSDVWAVAVTPDGRRAVSGSRDGTVVVWDVESGRLLRALERRGGAVMGVAVTAGGRLVLAASSDKTVEVWDAEQGALLRALAGHARHVSAVAVTPDGRLAVSASYDGSLRVWDVARGRCQHALQVGADAVLAVALTADGRVALSGSWDGAVKVWDVEAGRLVRALGVHENLVSATAATPDGRVAISASWDKTLKVWDVERGVLLRTLEGHTDKVACVAVTADGRLAASGSWDRTSRQWDVGSGQLLRTLEGHTSSVFGVAVTAEGRLCLSASGDETVKVWEPGSARRARASGGQAVRVNDVAVAADGRVAIGACGDDTLRVWDVERGQLVRALEGHADLVSAVAATPDGRVAVSASWDQTLKVWDVEGGRVVRTLAGHAGAVRGVAVTPDARLAVSASADGTVLVWRVERGEVLHTLAGHTGVVTGVAMTPDGRLAVSASKDATLKVWDLERGEVVRTLEGHTGEVARVAVTADGRLAVSASEDGTLKVWSVESGYVLRTLEGHTADVIGAAVSSDGRFAASASFDHTIRTWDVASGRPLLALATHVLLTCCALAPDGRTLLAGDEVGALHVLDVVG